MGIDVGGTFIDLVLQRDDGVLISEKLLSTPDDLVEGIRAGLARLLEAAGTSGGEVSQIIHATTLGSNVVIERRGPPAALLTTRGFRDVLHIARSLRFSMYDVQIEKREQLIPRARVWEVTQRSAPDGSELLPLAEDEVAAIARELRESDIVTVAVAYLHSYAAPEHERRTREILAAEAPELCVTISSDVSLQAREYERTNTALVNAYLVPVLKDYLLALARMLPGLGVAAPLWMMQSSGGLIPAERAAALPVRTIESGPAAGVLMAAHHGKLAGGEDVISFDMGGTTAKAAAIVGGRPATSRSFELERLELRPGSGLPLDISAIDLVEVGAGGGSIAEARAGVLRVGPRSAGAAPGPACYGRGGTDPTVTDANLILGYLNAEYFAGGALRLDRAAAEAAVGRLGTELGLEPLRSAWGIHEVVNLEMERALRLISVNRGLDPRDFAMVCFGGAAPAHGARLARALGVPRMLVPPAAGVGSALGLLEAIESFELAQTALLRLDEPGAGEQVRGLFAQLEEEARATVGAGWGGGELSVHLAAGLRYAGQGYEIDVRLEAGPEDVDALLTAFHAQYERAFGYREELAVEGVSWYLTLMRAGETRRTRGLEGAHAGHAARKGERTAYFPEPGLVGVPVYDRLGLRPGERLVGPALVEEAHTTTVVLPGDRVRVDADLALIVDIGGSDGA